MPLEQFVSISHCFKYIFIVIGSISSLRYKGFPSVHCGAMAQLVTKLSVITGTGKRSRGALKAGSRPVELLSIIWAFILPSLKRLMKRGKYTFTQRPLSSVTLIKRFAQNYRSLYIIWSVIAILLISPSFFEKTNNGFVDQFYNSVSNIRKESKI